MMENMREEIINNPKMKMYYDKFKKFNDNMNYKRCLRLEKKLISITNQNNDSLYNVMIKSHGITLFHLKKYEEAISYLKNALNMVKDDNQKELHEINNFLYQAYYKMSDYYHLIEFGLKTCEYEQIDPLEKAVILSTVSRFNYMLYLSRHKTTYLIRGLFYNTESQKLFESLNRINTEAYIHTLHDCGDINFALEDYDVAINNYEQVIKLTNNPDILFGIYSNLIFIYKEKGYCDTVLFYKKKLDLYKKK